MLQRLIYSLIRLVARAVEQLEHELRAARRARIDREHPPVLIPRLFAHCEPSRDMQIANEFVLRDALKKALRQHQPEEPPFEA